VGSAPARPLDRAVQYNERLALPIAHPPEIPRAERDKSHGLACEEKDD